MRGRILVGWLGVKRRERLLYVQLGSRDHPKARPKLKFQIDANLPRPPLPGSMTSTSFPSFNSFPELDPGPSNRTPRNNDKHKNRRKKDKHRHPDPTTLNDECLKTDEDRKSKLKDTGGSKPPLYYSDRKGDSLNVTYDTLHAGNIPKYRLINGTHAFPWYRAAYGRLIYRRKTNIRPEPAVDCCTQGPQRD